MLTGNKHLNIRASLSAPLEPIEPWAPPFAPPPPSPVEAKSLCDTSTLRHRGTLYMFARAASSPMSSAGRARLTPLPRVTARGRFRPPARIIFQFEEKWGMAEARISVGPGLLCCIKPSWSWKVSRCNEPRPCRRCANIPQDAACILIADCERVFARVCSVCAHDRASSPCSCEEQGNRVTL